MNSKIVKGKIETESLTLAEAVLDECDDLERVLLSWTDKELIEGQGVESGYFERCINNGDLPPIRDAKIDNYKFFSIYLKEENKLIGYFDLYFGYPTDDTVWISIFVIDGSYRKKGYAQEVIDKLSQEFMKNGFCKLGVGVYLNNWRALRFWTKVGFDKVLGVFCDGDFHPDKYAIIRLEKNCKSIFAE